MRLEGTTGAELKRVLGLERDLGQGQPYNGSRGARDTHASRRRGEPSYS